MLLTDIKIYLSARTCYYEYSSCSVSNAREEGSQWNMVSLNTQLLSFQSSGVLLVLGCYSSMNFVLVWLLASMACTLLNQQPTVRKT